VEVSTFLVAVERIISGVEVDDNAHRRLAMSFQEQVSLATIKVRIQRQSG
jgi:hypothetical protein